jgi:NTP pyrophosphatase (non-canonical NTP hydrolase)
MSYDKMEDTIQEAYKNVKLFNQIASNLDSVTPDSIDNQLSFIWEEMCEAIDAVESKDEVELLDATCDIFVTVAGLMQKMEAVGFDVAGALNKVNENNLSKFPQGDLAVIKNIPQTTEVHRKYEEVFDLAVQPPNTVKEYNSQHSVYVFKDKETGKIKKPTNFVPVNLKGFEVVGFLAGGV